MFRFGVPIEKQPVNKERRENTKRGALKTYDAPSSCWYGPASRTVCFIDKANLKGPLGWQCPTMSNLGSQKNKENHVWVEIWTGPKTGSRCIPHVGQEFLPAGKRVWLKIRVTQVLVFGSMYQDLPRYHFGTFF